MANTKPAQWWFWKIFVSQCFVWVFFFFLTLLVLWFYNMVSNFVSVDFLCVQMCVSQHLYGFFMIFLWLPHPCQFVVFILSNFIIILGAFLYSNEREKGKGCGFGWVERIWEALGEGNHDQNILYGKKLFS